jgi:HSF-type DNA-binding
MPPRQEILTFTFDRTMHPRLPGDVRKKSDTTRPTSSNDEPLGQGAQLDVAIPHLSASGIGQTIPTVLQQRPHPLQLIEQQQQLRAISHQMMGSRVPSFGVGRMDPRRIAWGASDLLGTLQSLSLTASEATLATAILARQRREQEEAIFFHRQLLAMDVDRFEQLVASGRQFSNRHPFSGALAASANDLGLGTSAPTNFSYEGGSMPAGGLASLLVAARRETLHPLNSNTALPDDPLATERASRTPVDDREGSDDTEELRKDDKDNLLMPAGLKISDLIERHTTGGTKEASFPLKLHAILADPENHGSICWLPHGRTWRVIRMAKFEMEVIPRYFRHTKYASFMRQGEYCVLFSS